MMESKTGIGNRYRNGYTTICSIFDGWLSSKKSAEYSMEVVADLICMVKTNTKVFCIETTDNLKKYWTGGSHLVLRIKNMVPRGKSIISIGYKYNARKILSFIVTDNTGITHAGLAYLSRYPDQFYNVSILAVVRPLVRYAFFGSVNEFDSRNISTQSDMLLEKFWVTQCCCI